mgnify:CR=1 FL=1
MIIPKESQLTHEQLKEVTEIVEEYGCKVQTIVGHHRSIYAVLGEERETLMVNRLLGLSYIDRFDAIDSPFKLMDIHSEMAHHQIGVGNTICGNTPLVIAGHCTIDPANPNLFYETAHAVKEAGASALRGGVWKPRTMPYSFQGDNKSIEILMEAKSQTGLPVDTEVMDEEQLQIAVDAGVDILQVGARNALNYSLLKKIGQMTARKPIKVLLKRSIGMGPINEFIAAAEYIAAAGNPDVMLCPRGTKPTMDGYRNHPDESITPLLKEKSWAPVIVDPSHSVGRAKYVPSAALSAMSYGADGVIVETHCNPKFGIGDDPKQSLTPSVLEKLIKDINAIWEIRKHYREQAAQLA